jgi:SAM-dependent methyltransferase
VKLTGERPMEGSTPDSLLALHDAGYREVLARLGPGRVLDVGCGVGSETARLAAPGRDVVGIDYDPETAVLARREWGPEGPHGTDVEFAAMDGAHLGFKDGSFDWVCSSHIIEHFVGPELHVAELARVSADDGTTFVITPNRPADFENPFHVYLFEPAELASMLRLFFGDVEVWGLEGDDELKADFASRRESGERLLKLDVFNLRQKMPRSWYVWSYERALPVVYKFLGSENSGVGSGLDDSHFTMTDVVVPTTPVLFAIARKPRRFPEH